jgi:hypothetical protein
MNVHRPFNRRRFLSALEIGFHFCNKTTPVPEEAENKNNIRKGRTRIQGRRNGGGGGGGGGGGRAIGI